MSTFFKKFLLEDLSKPQIYLSAFGKHPGWNDHIEELGIETETLALCRSIFYVKGIGGLISAGRWNKPIEGADSEKIAFDHFFLWHRNHAMIFGLLWPSSDGKRRRQYPMIICVHCVRLPLNWVLEHILSKLEELKKICIGTESASTVRSSLAAIRNSLRSKLAESPPEEPHLLSLPEHFDQFANHPDFGTHRQGLIRILYQFKNQLSIYGKGIYNPKNFLTQESNQGDLIRLPLGTDTPVKSISAWIPFLRTQIDWEVPLLLMVPRQHRWSDAIFGEPTQQSLFCLKASQEHLPLTSDIPYNFNDDFLQTANQLLDSLITNHLAKSSTNIFGYSAELTDHKDRALKKASFFKRLLKL